MRTLILLIFPILCQAQTIINQPYLFNKYATAKDSFVAPSFNLKQLNAYPTAKRIGQLVCVDSTLYMWNGQHWQNESSTNSYYNGFGLNLTGNHFSADSSILATKQYLVSSGYLKSEYDPYYRIDSGAIKSGLRAKLNISDTTNKWAAKTHNQPISSIVNLRDSLRYIHIKTAYFDTLVQIPSYIKGTVYWDAENYTLSVQTGLDGASMQVGQELYTLVQNNTGSPITAGKAAYIINAGGEIPRIQLSDSSTASRCYKTIGVTTTNILHGSLGFITTFGEVHDLNTNGWEGLDFYVLNNGNIGITKPKNHMVCVGRVIYGHSSNGILYVNIKNETSTYLAVLNNSGNAGVTIDTTNAVRLKGTTTVWDDLMFPFETGQNAGTAYPLFNADSMYYSFVIDTTGVSKCIKYFTVQLPHKWAGTNILPHVHYKHETAVGSPTFKVKYKWYDTLGSTQSGWKWLTMDQTTGTTDKTVQMCYSTSGISPQNFGISSICLIQVYLTARTGTGNVNAYQFDIHYEIDGFGSNNTTTKY